MKLTIDPIKCGLREQVAFAASAINQRSTLPVLGLMRLVSRGNNFELSSTNLEQTTIARVSVKNLPDGAMLLPPFVLKDVVEREKVFTLESEDGKKDSTVALTTDFGSLKAATLNSDEFPPTPEIKGANRIVINAEKIFDALRSAAVFASVDESRYAICGALVEVKDKIVRVVATDGRRIMVKELGETECNDAKFTMPSSALKLVEDMELANQFTPVSETIEITWDESNARFDCGDYSLITKVIDASYPSWRQVIPAAKPATQIVVRREEFIRAVTFAKSCATDAKRGVTLNLGHKLSISSASTETGKSQSSFVAEKAGVDLKVLLDPKYLLDAADVFASKTLTLDFNGEYDPMKITCDDGTAVIMPMGD